MRTVKLPEGTVGLPENTVVFDAKDDPHEVMVEIEPTLKTFGLEVVRLDVNGVFIYQVRPSTDEVVEAITRPTVVFRQVLMAFFWGTLIAGIIIGTVRACFG